MKKTLLILLAGFISLAVFAGDKQPGQERKSFGIHKEKRMLKHENKGKHHDYRKNLHHRRHEAAKHHQRMHKHRTVK